MSPFLLLHVAISLVGIASGLVVVPGMLVGKRFDGISLLFLVTTIATSLTGFLLPLKGLTPPVVVAILSLLVLAVACAARYTYTLRGSWRWIYVVTATVALYFNVFVLVVQLFLKVPSLNALAPTQSEPAVLIAQLATLVFFVVLGTAAVVKFRPEAGTRSAASLNRTRGASA